MRNIGLTRLIHAASGASLGRVAAPFNAGSAERNVAAWRVGGARGWLTSMTGPMHALRGVRLRAIDVAGGAAGAADRYTNRTS